MIRLIVAHDIKRGIGKNGSQPWKLPADEAYFDSMTKTKGAKVLVGSATYATFRGPLADRENYVLTSKTQPTAGVHIVNDLTLFLDDIADDDLWVIGGANIYKQVIEAGRADELYITHIDADFDCDRFFPDYEANFEQVSKTATKTENNLNFYYAVYSKRTNTSIV